MTRKWSIFFPIKFYFFFFSFMKFQSFFISFDSSQQEKANFIRINTYRIKNIAKINKTVMIS